MRALIGAGTRFDALLIEATLPDGDGRELCRSLRAGGMQVPILMLAQSARETDVVWALDAGASDYLPKPLRPAELAARLRAQLRAFDASEHAEIALGSCVFRPGLRTVTPRSGGRATRLTDKEAGLLKHLCRAQGRPVTRDTLLREVWGYRADASTHTVETHVYRLRLKIEEAELAGPRVVSEGGCYRLELEPPAARRWPHRETAARTHAMAAQSM